MNILISNDDGIHAPGLKSLYQWVNDAKSVTLVQVVAPDRDRSAASHSLTLNAPLYVTPTKPNRYCVNGTPTDCVHLAITGLFDTLPDMVVSGINAGANLGDDVLYSGTVAAAMEGRTLGYPSIAVSLVQLNPEQPLTHYDTAARVIQNLLNDMPSHPLPSRLILNVNVPDVPYEDLKGVEVTRLGSRHRAEPSCAMTDPRGKTIYWIGPSPQEQDAGEGTDFFAVKNHRVSVTPLHFDLTCHDQKAPTQAWIDSFDHLIK